MRFTIWTLFGILALIAVYLRLAPTPVEKWHVDPEQAPDPRPRGHRSEITLKGSPQQLLDDLVSINGIIARTRVFTGDSASGRITFVSHSTMMGFPFYTTVSAVKKGKMTKLIFLGRLRYGWSDFGINRRRIKSWIKALQSINQ